MFRLPASCLWHEWMARWQGEAVGRFERAYGPAGAWSQSFGRYPGFRGTTLLRDARRPRRYLTIDLWDTRGQREQMLTLGRAAYSELDTACGDWTESEADLGIFEVVAETTTCPWRLRVQQAAPMLFLTLGVLFAAPGVPPAATPQMPPPVGPR